MLAQFEWWHGAFLILAVVLEIVANIFLKMSNGFSRMGLGILSLVCVLGAFSALAMAVKGIELSVAYALWGHSELLQLSLPVGFYLINDSIIKDGVELYYYWLGW